MKKSNESSIKTNPNKNNMINTKPINNNSLSGRKNPNFLNNEEEENKKLEKDEKYAEDRIIAKLMKKGFESLTIEELAVTMISPTFEAEYQLKTGNDWNSQYKIKAGERLNFAKFDINWNNRLSKAPFGVLFDLVEKGDTQRVTEFMRKNAQYQEELLQAVDKSKKSPLHVASKCGHTTLTSVLISRGYSVHLRDKFLRTPLHLACQFGNGTVTDVLLKSKSDIYSRDSIGRTCLHYAATSNSIEIITLLLGTDPDLVHTKDAYGRHPLHYSVWNSNPNQLEIAKKLLDAKCEVDSIDDEGMTPLHYAADGRKGRIIPLLLRYGANPSLRDGRTHRTAFELALTEHIREIIIVYSGKPYALNQDDKEYLDQGVEGERLDVNNVKEEERKDSRRSKPRLLNKKLAPVIEEKDDNFNEFLMKTQKDKLVAFMKNIQEYGVKSMQHLTKPSLYSGSWLENINNIDELYKYLNTLSSTEAVLRIFNILSPYENVFPQGKGQEVDMAIFFNEGEKVTNNFAKMSNTNLNAERESDIYVRNEMDKQNKYFEEQKAEIKFLTEEIKNLQNKITEKNEEEKESQLTIELKNQISKYELENNILKDNSNKLLDNVNTLTESLNSYKTLITDNKKVYKILTNRKNSLINI